ncbi:MAG: hypothetical protein HY584_05455 [Candidatus Omnitrophica bacterium]|nr:hypothetical protein [Candidatus Omnitrophota bacterium]
MIPSPPRTPPPLKVSGVFSTKIEEHASLEAQNCFLNRAPAVAVMG